MKQTTRLTRNSEGELLRQKTELKDLLNYHILDLLNKAPRTGPFDMPVIDCHSKAFPDYLALYQQPGLYQAGDRTAVCFYTYDKVFDGKHGLFWAIYYHDKDRLAFFRERFKEVRYFITPDYSMFGDVHVMENLIRLWKAHVVALWFILELHAVVIPSIAYFDLQHLDWTFSGYENCSVIAASAKGHTRYASERRLFMEVIKYAVDHLPLETIIVYSACGQDETCLKLFSYAIQRGIRIIIPQNTLRERNMARRVENGR